MNLIKNRRFFYRYRGVLMAPPYLVLVMLFVWETEHDLIVWPLGLTLFSAGFAIRVWAQMYVKYRLPVHKTLALSGPYRYVRNPIYLGNAMILIGLAVASELLWFVPIMFIWVAAVYHHVVKYEESHLKEKYGEPYREFLKRVPRWIPRISSEKPGTSRWRKLLIPSIAVELHCLLLLIPIVGKEFFGSAWNLFQ